MEPNEPGEQVVWRLIGRVQGVGFRWWTLRAAARLGLRGTVRNCPDGSVEVMAGGDPESIRRFRELLEQGPHGARVDAIVCESAGTPLPPDFRVLY